jgi:hypothetical protein
LSTTSGEGPFATSFQYSNASTIISSGDGGANDTFVRVIGGKYAEANTTNLDLIHVGKDNNRDQGWRIRSGCGVGSTTNNGYLSFLQLSTSGSAITELLEAARFSTDGNLLIGTTIDGGQKLQVSGTAAISNLLTAAGASISGSNAPSAGASVEINYGQISNSGRIFAYDRTGSAFKDIYLDGSSITLRSGASATTALTLDSSQRCILAGALRLNNAYVSGAPTATGYVTLQDSAGNTYKVLVGT